MDRKYITAEGPSSELLRYESGPNTGKIGAHVERVAGHTYPAPHEPVRFEARQSWETFGEARDRNGLPNETEQLRAQLETARKAFINIQNFVRDHNGSSWDGVRSFCKAALAQIGAGQKGGK